MADIVRRNPNVQLQPRERRDPLQTLRDLFEWDPTAQLPSLLGREMFAFIPAFEVKETADAYVFKADLPGVAEEDLEITLTGNRLNVSGRREAEKSEEGESYYAYERAYGTFNRSFTLPEGVDPEHVEAELKHGVLMLRVPKRPEHHPKKISLKGLAERVKGVLGKDKEKGVKA